MELVGYSDRLTVAPGERIRFMVSARVPGYDAAIVRLVHGDPNPDGPGVRIHELPTAIDGRYPGREQALLPGSYVTVPDHPAFHNLSRLTIQAWLYATTPDVGVQGVVTKWSEADQRGYGLFIDEAGCIAMRIGDGATVVTASTGRPLRSFEWYCVIGGFDLERGIAFARQQPVRRWPIEDSAGAIETPLATAPAATAAPLLIAGFAADAGSRPRVRGHLNGKVDAPSLFADALAGAAIDALAAGAVAADVGAAVIASWDFSRDISSAAISDTSGNDLHGTAVNMPMRGVTGWNFTGREPNFNVAPAEYGAIFFHDDDLEDAGWEVDFEFDIPDDLRSGVYAARLRSEEFEDYVPFFVRPRSGSATARIAFLASTYTYLAYANEHYTWKNPSSPVEHGIPIDQLLSPADHYAADENLMSLYDHHRDGTGVCYASRRLVNMRPGYNLPLINGPIGFNADLHLTDWLEAKGFEYDVLTDEDLQREGSELLRPYTAVLSGSHHEYWTGAMLDALQEYLDAGGRFMSLTGNGYYWPIGVDADRPHIIEVRRGQNGTGTWKQAPGENHLSTTGELGGLWRDRGRAPNRLVGAGFVSSGFDRALPYHRAPASNDPRAAFIFDGVPQEGPIGEHGLVMGGAAGLEVDCANRLLGTPPHALVLASALGFSRSYQKATEDLFDANEQTLSEPFARADLVFFETLNGGAVFAVGSITWCGSLSWNGYDNAVSKITENVLTRFADEAPLA